MKRIMNILLSFGVFATMSGFILFGDDLNEILRDMDWYGWVEITEATGAYADVDLSRRDCIPQLYGGFTTAGQHDGYIEIYDSYNLYTPLLHITGEMYDQSTTLDGQGYVMGHTITDMDFEITNLYDESLYGYYGEGTITTEHGSITLKTLLYVVSDNDMVHYSLNASGEYEVAKNYDDYVIALQDEYFSIPNYLAALDGLDRRDLSITWFTEPTSDIYQFMRTDNEPGYSQFILTSTSDLFDVRLCKLIYDDDVAVPYPDPITTREILRADTPVILQLTLHEDADMPEYALHFMDIRGYTYMCPISFDEEYNYLTLFIGD